MWRRVQCEQPLDTGQSILRLRGNPIKLCGVFLFKDRNFGRKGMRSLFLNLIAELFDPRINVATRKESETSTRALGRVVFSA